MRRCGLSSDWLSGKRACFASRAHGGLRLLGPCKASPNGSTANAAWPADCLCAADVGGAMPAAIFRSAARCTLVPLAQQALPRLFGGECLCGAACSCGWCLASKPSTRTRPALRLGCSAIAEGRARVGGQPLGDHVGPDREPLLLVGPVNHRPGRATHHCRRPNPHSRRLANPRSHGRLWASRQPQHPHACRGHLQQAQVTLWHRRRPGAAEVLRVERVALAQSPWRPIGNFPINQYHAFPPAFVSGKSIYMPFFRPQTRQIDPAE